jgi:hypothetical protein
VRCDHDLNSLVPDDLVKNMEMIGSIEDIMRKWVPDRKLSRLIDDKPGRAWLTTADVKMSDMYFVPLR